MCGKPGRLQWAVVNRNVGRRNAYCELCRTKQDAYDGGIVESSLHAMGQAMAAVHNEIEDAAETRRLTALLLEGVLEDGYDGHIDTPAFNLGDRWEPISEEMPA